MTPKPQKGNIHYSTALSGRRLSVTSSHALHTFILLTIILSSYHDIYGYLINQSNKVQTKNSTKSKKQYLNILWQLQVASFSCSQLARPSQRRKLLTSRGGSTTSPSRSFTNVQVPAPAMAPSVGATRNTHKSL